jgi:tetratricopeptide (TPR) repeat protein
MPASDTEDTTSGGKSYLLSGDFRGAIVNIESTFVKSAAVQDIEGLAPEPGTPPYRGLQYFDEADADHFLGREMLTARLVERLGQTRFLAVIGASGSGKSSVVRAGLVPALRRGKPLADGALPPTGADRWLIRVMTPTAHPLDALAAALLPEAESAATAGLRDRLATNTTTLAETGPVVLGDKHPRLLLIVDQFEEVFSLGRHEEERRAFIDNLVAAAGGDQPITIVIVLRADFYARCAQYDGLRELVSHHQEYIGAMSREELFRVIVLPAARDNWKLQEGLVELMLDDVGDEPGALPLLSHALLETWQRRRGRTMTLSGYKESGGVRGAIAKTAETVFRQRLTPEQQSIARMIFVRLTELGERVDSDTPDTRRRAQFSELITRSTDASTLEAVLSILVDSRLVMTNVIPPGETKVVEVSHEALIREWPTLRDWLNQDREGLIRHRQLTADVNDWLSLSRDSGALYRGAKLDQTLAWTAGPPDPLSEVELEFLEASRKLASQAKKEALFRRALIGVSVALLLGITGMVIANLGLFDPPDKMSGELNIAVAEFAILDNEGKLINDDTVGGIRIAEQIGTALLEEFGDREGVQVWYDSPELARDHKVEIGVAGQEPIEATDPAELAEELNADMVIYGVAEPSGQSSDLTLQFYLREQYDADFSQMVGNYEFNTPIPVFNPSNPSDEVWRALNPLARALAWVTVGLRQEILGEQDEASQAFARAVELAPDSDVIHYFVGQEAFYTTQRDPNEPDETLAAAEAAFTESLRLNPENARARIGLGSVHFLRAQRLLNDIRNDAAGPDRDADLEEVGTEARAALDSYTLVAAQPEQTDIYGVPVAGMARVGQGISLRLLAEVAFEQGDLQAAETHIDEAIAALEDEIELLDTPNDPRLPAQAYQALGSFYEWKAFLLDARGADAAGADSRAVALDYYNACVEQGEAFRFDTYLLERIVQQLCMPRIEVLQAPAGGG